MNHYLAAYSLKMQRESFFDMVYEVVRLIPRGRVTSYGAIARYLGSGNSARMVGYALNGAWREEDIPAHRVVNRIGVLTGKHHFPGTFAMEQLLEEEGIQVKEDRVVDFKELFWDPQTELDQHR